MTTLSILIFDSGVGGLGIYNEVKSLIPSAHYIYVFDNQGFPYGEKSAATIKRRIIAIIDKLKASYKIDLAVIACNTATVVSLLVLRQRYDFPIVGVVPAIKLAVQMKTGKPIGLLATKATITSRYTAKLIKQFAGGCPIRSLAVNELANLAEQKLQGTVVDKQNLIALMQPWLNLPYSLNPIILGCTHYFFIKEELQSIFPDSQLICSNRAVAKQVATLFKSGGFLVEEQCHCENIAISTIFDAATLKLIPVLKTYDLPIYETISLCSE